MPYFSPDLFWQSILTCLFWLYVAATLMQLAVIFETLRNWKLEIEKFTNRQALISNFQFPISNFSISILICARNEADNLYRYLPKILEQEYPGEWEVLVVDDASEDDTPIVLQFFQEKNPRLRVVRVLEKKIPGKKHALAQGIAATKFENLLLTDADCEPISRYWLAHMAASLAEKRETEIVLGYGPFNLTPGPSPVGRGDVEHTVTTSRTPLGYGPGVRLNGWTRFETAHVAIQYFSFALAGMPYMGVGRNLAFKKRAFERAGGFAAHLDLPSGDDDLLVNAAANAQNVAICLHPESFVFSESKKTWREWAIQKHRHLAAGKRYRRRHQVVLALLSLSHVLHYFLLVVLLLAGSGMVSVGVLYFSRMISLLILYASILPKLRESRLLSRVPIYDTLLAAYYGAFVPISLILPLRVRSPWK